MENIFSRNELIWGKKAQDTLKEKHIAVFGLGGVGGYALESLARSGIGYFTIVDFDKVSVTNINRQIIALHSTVGENKAKLFKERLLDINPDVKINVIENFYNTRLNDLIFAEKVDFVVDAIDTMHSKIELLTYFKNNDIPVVTSMGAGNRLDPTMLYLTDISKIENKKDVFVKNILYQLAQNGIESGITAVVSREKPHVAEKIMNTEKIQTPDGEYFEFNKISPGSTPFVPAVAGYYMAFFVLKSILNIQGK